MMTFHRRAALGLGASLLAAPALGQGRFPNRPIRFLIPWAPGGLLDGFMRLQNELFLQEYGQSIIIENRPGARGTLAAQQLLTQARPDGYTIAHHHLSVIRHPFLTKRPTWDPVNDFTYIMQQTGFIFGHVVHPASGWNSLKDMFAEARQKPGQLTYGTSGIATSNHLAMEELCEKEGVEMTHVPYRGTAPAVNDLLSGVVQLTMTGAPAVLPHARAGTLRALGISSEKRLASANDIPTIAEQGVPNFEASQWYGIVGPAGMPQPIIDRLNAEIRKAMTDPEIVAALAREGAEAWVTSPEELRAHIAKEIPRWAEIVKLAKIRIE